MIKLTDSQLAELGDLALDWGSIQYTKMQKVVDRVVEIINTSSTHRVVEAPEGYAVDFVRHDEAQGSHFSPVAHVVYKRIPKPCPSPVLDPVAVEWADVYECEPVIPDGYEAVFGLVRTLKAKGFTHYLGNKLGLVSTLPGLDESQYRIGLRKWEGK